MQTMLICTLKSHQRILVPDWHILAKQVSVQIQQVNVCARPNRTRDAVLSMSGFRALLV